MQYEDRVTIPTPEGVDVDLTLAGIGSRFIAVLIDTAIKVIALLGFFIFLFGGASLLGGGGIRSLSAAAYYIIAFLILFAYDIFFETLWSGQTPGKKWTGLRVVRMGGRPIGFVASAIRNVVRIVDFLPSLYLVGMITVLVTTMNQRLGDLAAGTVVVRQNPVVVAPPSSPAVPSVPVPEGIEAWDVAAITTHDLATVRRFLERRGELAPHARGHLAHELANRLQHKVVGAPPLPPETFLELVSAAKAKRA